MLKMKVLLEAESDETDKKSFIDVYDITE